MNAKGGGSIYLTGTVENSGQLYATSCWFVKNQAVYGNGGALHAQLNASITLVETNVSHNKITDAIDGKGGAGIAVTDGASLYMTGGKVSTQS